MKVFGLRNKKWYTEATILSSTLLVFLVCSSLMLVLLENYRLTIDLNQRTEKYYLAKIMKQLALSKITIAQGKGSYEYSTGIVFYERIEKEVVFRIQVLPYTFEFTEKLNNDTVYDTADP